MCWSWDPEQDCDKQGPIPQSLLLAFLQQYAKHTPSSLYIQTGSCCRVWEALVLVALVHLIQERQMFWWITVGCYLIQHEIIIFQKGNLTHLMFTLINPYWIPQWNCLLALIESKQRSFYSTWAKKGMIVIHAIPSWVLNIVVLKLNRNNLPHHFRTENWVLMRHFIICVPTFPNHKSIEKFQGNTFWSR